MERPQLLEKVLHVAQRQREAVVGRFRRFPREQRLALPPPEPHEVEGDLQVGDEEPDAEQAASVGHEEEQDAVPSS